MDKKNLMVIFPGMGYNTSRPVLYYTRKLAQKYGYEIREVNFSFPEKAADVKGKSDKMSQSFEIAMSHAREQLAGIDYGSYDRVIFVGKSIGTVVAAAYDKQENVNAEHIIYTPLPHTFKYSRKECGIMVHGTSDPWCETQIVDEKSRELNIECIKVADANHSLETDSVQTDLGNLMKIMVKIEMYVNGGGDIWGKC
ncbi:MAG: hypothetical protein J5802_14305 [Butyrivibrio sp.]|nr:hypothetical protein [Butyrivibrio sp.]